MRTIAMRAVLALCLAVASLTVSGGPVHSSSAEPTSVTGLNIHRFGFWLASLEDMGPIFWFTATDPEGISRVVGRWCSDEVPDYCLSPAWTPETPGTLTWNGVEVMVDVPADAPLGMYAYKDITFTDGAGNTTTFLTDGKTLVNGDPGAPHSFSLEGGLEVIDEAAPTLEAVHWADGRDWAVIGGDDSVAMDLHVTDNYRKALYASVRLEEADGSPGLTLQANLPELGTGSQDGWVRATGVLGGGYERTSAQYEVSYISLRDAQGNSRHYRPDGTVIEDPWFGKTVTRSHEFDLASMHLQVRDEVASLYTMAPIADSTLKLAWSPAVDADGSAPQHYTVRLAPFERSGLDNGAFWTPEFWVPSDLPERFFTLPGDQTTLVVDELDNGRRYEIEVTAEFSDRSVTLGPAAAIPWPEITYTPAVQVVEGDQGVSYAVITGRLSSPSLLDINQGALLSRGTAWEQLDYLELPLGSLEFPAGATSATMKVAIVGDSINEPDETFAVRRSIHYGVPNENVKTIITIIDDDPAPGAPLAIGSTTAPGTGTGQAPAFLTVRLARKHRTAVTVDYRTIDRTAVAGRDYRATHGTLRFKAGVVARTIAIPVYARNTGKNVSFVVRLRNANGAVISTAVGRVTIDR